MKNHLRRGDQWAAFSGLCATLALAGAGCSSAEEHVTQVVVQVDAQRGVSEQLTAVDVEVYDVEAPASAQHPVKVSGHRFASGSREADRLQFPFSFGVVKHNAGRFLLVVTGYVADALVIESKVQVGFVERQTRGVELVLSDTCFMQLCARPGDANWYLTTCQAAKAEGCDAVETAITTPVIGGEADDAGVRTITDAESRPGHDGARAADTSMSDASRPEMSAPPDAAGSSVETADAHVDFPPADGGWNMDASMRDAGAPKADASTAMAVDATTTDPVTCYRVFFSSMPHVAAPGVDEHPQLFVDAPWGNAVVQAVRVTPLVDNAAALKHWTLYNNVSKRLVASWGPGMQTVSLPADVGIAVPSGPGSLRFDVYYRNDAATSVSDQSGVELCVTPDLRANSAALALLGTPLFTIPPMVSNYEVKGTCSVQASAPITIIGIAPFAGTHANRLAVATGNSVLHDAPYSHDAHGYYSQDHITVKAGEQISVSCFYNNPTSSNISFGENLANDMCFAAVTYYPDGAITCTLGLPVFTAQ